MKTGTQERNTTSPDLKSRFEFETEEAVEQLDVTIKGAEMLPEDTTVHDCEPNELALAPLVQEAEVSEKSKSFGKLWLVGLIAIVGLSALELVLFTRQLIEQQDLLGGLWLVVLCLFLTLAIVELAKQWFGLKRLKQQEVDKLKAEQIFNSPAIGMGESFCQHLAKGLPDQRKAEIANWKNSLESHHNDKEILALFEQTVMVAADEAAIKKITQHASAAGAMIAVSPFALLDMAIVLWRNFKMMNPDQSGLWRQAKLLGQGILGSECI